MRNIIFLTFLMTFLASCAGQEAAPVYLNQGTGEVSAKTASDNNEEEVILKPLATGKDYDPVKGYLKEKQPEDPMTIRGHLQDNTKVIYHEVQVGETIDSLVANYGGSKEEIISQNDLTPPFKLEEFQIIKIKVSSDILNKRNREQTPEVVAGSNVDDQPQLHNINIIKPLEGTIITRFGEAIKTGKNNGINIQAPAGTAVKSVADGVVVKAGNSPRYGNLVIVKLDAANLFVAYAHLKDLILKVDQKVSQGEIIGRVGTTGNVDISQLHFAIKDGEKAVDPLKYIPDLGN